MRCIFLVVVSVLPLPFCHTATLYADDNIFPSSLIEFIKPGMRLGVKPNQTESLIGIEIFSDDQFRLAKDAREMTLEELGKKYPHVADKVAKTLANFTASLKAMKSRIPKVANPAPPGEPVITLAVDRAVLLCTVLYTGTDYILVTYGADNSKKQVIAIQSVARIRWADDDLKLRTSWRPDQGKVKQKS